MTRYSIDLNKCKAYRGNITDIRPLYRDNITDIRPLLEDCRKEPIKSTFMKDKKIPF